jgi:hypothetical protein
MKELIEFFSSGKENATGLYYDNKWIINNDRAIDKGINLNDFETMTSDQIIKERSSPSRTNQILAMTLDPVSASTGGAYGIFGFTDNASIIDTPTEGMDDKLNQEYRSRVKNIIYQEKSFVTPEVKKTVEQKIVEYITTNTKNG